MWIVRLALRRPYTFVVVSLLILILGIGSAIETPKDIFPYIDIPVVTIIWTYGGLTPTEMEGRVVTVSERALTTTVNDIEHTESESYQGVSIIKVFFQPTVKVELALSQITSIVQTILRVLPPGTTPPAIIKYDASSVPILQLAMSGEGLTEADLYDYGLSFVRPRLATVKGASVPSPYGGKVRQIQVDTDPNLMYAHHLSATDVSAAMNLQNLILPAGTARLGDKEFVVKMNSSTGTVAALNDLPIRASNGAVVFIKDVAQVREGYATQTNIVRNNGKRSALLTILKNGNTSTLDIVSQVKESIPRLVAGAGTLKLTPLFEGVSYERLEELGSIQWPCNDQHPEGTPTMQFGEFVRGKGKFLLTEYVPTAEKVNANYPLILTTGRILSQYNVGAQTRRTENNRWHDEDRLEIHPHDAEERGIAEGDWVGIASRAGDTVLRARVTERVQPGVVYTTFHFPESGANVIKRRHRTFRIGCEKIRQRQHFIVVRSAGCR